MSWSKQTGCCSHAHLGHEGTYLRFKVTIPNVDTAEIQEKKLDYFLPDFLGKNFV